MMILLLKGLTNFIKSFLYTYGSPEWFLTMIALFISLITYLQWYIKIYFIAFLIIFTFSRFFFQFNINSKWQTPNKLFIHTEV